MWELITLLIVSIFFNIVAFWYIRQILGTLLFITDNIDFIDTSLKTFQANLDAVYEAERFYGDETLEALCIHAREVAADLELFSGVVEVFIAAEVEEVEEVEEGEIEEDDLEPEEVDE